MVLRCAAAGVGARQSYECIHTSAFTRKTQHNASVASVMKELTLLQHTHPRTREPISIKRTEAKARQGLPCLALPTDIAPQYHRAWAVMSARLLIVLRGELNHKTRSRMTGMPPHSATWLVEEAEYRLIVRKLGEHVMKPIIRTRSWSPHVAIDFMMSGPAPPPPSIHAHIGAVLQLPPRSISLRTSRPYKNFTQGMNVVASLAWAEEAAGRPRAQGALILRNDLVFKHDLPFAAPQHMPSTTILVSFEQPQFLPGKRKRWLVDTIFYVPSKRMHEFTRAASLCSCCGMHDIAEHLNGTAPYGTFFAHNLALADSDPGKDWNPLYTFAGRTARVSPIHLVRFSVSELKAFNVLRHAGTTSTLHQGTRSSCRISEQRAGWMDGQRAARVEMHLNIRRPSGRPRFSEWREWPALNVSESNVCFVYPMQRYAEEVTWPARVDPSRVSIVWYNCADDGTHSLSDDATGSGSLLVLQAPVAVSASLAASKLSFPFAGRAWKR